MPNEKLSDEELASLTEDARRCVEHGAGSMRLDGRDVCAMLAEIREHRAAQLPFGHHGYPSTGTPVPTGTATPLALQQMRADIDEAIAAHDPNDPRHRSHGGQHHNGPCCVFGALAPSAIRPLRQMRDVLDRHGCAALTEEEREALRWFRDSTCIVKEQCTDIDGERVTEDIPEVVVALAALDKLLRGGAG